MNFNTLNAARIELGLEWPELLDFVIFWEQ